MIQWLTDWLIVCYKLIKFDLVYLCNDFRLFDVNQCKNTSFTYRVNVLANNNANDAFQFDQIITRDRISNTWIINMEEGTGLGGDFRTRFFHLSLSLMPLNSQSTGNCVSRAINAKFTWKISREFNHTNFHVKSQEFHLKLNMNFT